MGQLDYTPAQVTLALHALARNRGDVAVTSDQLINDEFMVSAELLSLWRNDTHAEQYKRIEENIGGEIERDSIATLQKIIKRSNELRLDMIEDVGEIKRQELLPNALRALNDAGAKATNQLMQLTGRPVNGNAGDASLDAMTRLVTGLQELGLVKIAPNIAATLSDGDVKEEPA